VKSSLFLATLFLFFCAFAFAQNSRYDAPASQTPGATVQFCGSPANGVPCSNFVTTYDFNGNACPNNAQDTAQPNGSCQPGPDNQGRVGAWLPSGTYTYTICVPGNNCSPPIAFSVGGGAPAISANTFNVAPSNSAATNLANANTLIAFLNTLSNGALVSFAGGIYSFSGNLNPITAAGIHLVGQGMGATILNRTAAPGGSCPSNCGLFTVTGANFEIDHLTIRGAGSFTGAFLQGGKGIYGPPAGSETHMSVHDIELAQLEGEAIYCNVCSQLSFRNNWAHNNAGNGFNPADQTATGVIADGNIFQQNEAGAMQPTAAELTVVNNFIQNVWGVSGNADLVLLQVPTHFVFAHNIIDGNVAINGTNCLVHVQASAGAPTFGIISNNVIRNNKTNTGASQAGLVCVGGNGGNIVGMLRISDNEFADNWNGTSIITYLIEIDGSANTAGIVIVGNSFKKGTAPLSTVTAINTDSGLSASNGVVIGVNTFSPDLDAQFALSVAPAQASFPNNGTCTAAAATSCTVTFATNLYKVAPFCQAVDQTNIVALKAAPTAASLVISTVGASSDVFAYSCSN
jgi:hypothetical protein